MEQPQKNIFALLIPLSWLAMLPHTQARLISWEIQLDSGLSQKLSLNAISTFFAFWIRLPKIQVHLYARKFSSASAKTKWNRRPTTIDTDRWTRKDPHPGQLFTWQCIYPMKVFYWFLLSIYFFFSSFPWVSSRGFWSNYGKLKISVLKLSQRPQRFDQ